MELERIRTSVSVFDDDYVILEQVVPQKAVPGRSTSDTENSLFVVLGPMSVQPNVSGQKLEKARVFSPLAVREKYWAPVVNMLNTAPASSVAVYYGVALPFEQTDDQKKIEGEDQCIIYSQTMVPWDSVFMVSRQPDLKMSRWVDQDLLIEPMPTLTHQAVLQTITQAMNTVISFWAIAPVNNNPTRSNLLASYEQKGRTVRGIWEADEDDYEVVYDNPDGEVDLADDAPDDESGSEDESQPEERQQQPAAQLMLAPGPLQIASQPPPVQTGVPTAVIPKAEAVSISTAKNRPPPGKEKGPKKKMVAQTLTLDEDED